MGNSHVPAGDDHQPDIDQRAADSSQAGEIGETAIQLEGAPPGTTKQDRRLSSDEWGWPFLAPRLIHVGVLTGAADASKVPPSQFQKRKGSIYATPGSRDGHVDRNYATEFHEKHAEKGYGKSRNG